MQKLTLLGLIYLCSTSQVIGIKLTGKIHDNVQFIEYFKPFEHFRNSEIPTIQMLDNNGAFLINFEIKKPVFITIKVSGNPIWLFLEPMDSLYVEVYPNKIKNNNKEWLFINGNNSDGHLFFNQFYNFYPFTKFIGVREIIDKNNYSTIKEFVKLLDNNYKLNIGWLDSLYFQKKITKTYLDFVSFDIKVILLHEAIVYGKNNKFAEYPNVLFSGIDANDFRFEGGLYGFSYLFDFYTNISKNKHDYTNSLFNEAIVHFTFAPKEQQSVFLGICLKIITDMGAYNDTTCNDVKYYIKVFPNGEFTEYLKSLDLCKPEKKDIKKLKFIEAGEGDFFSFLYQFSGKRIFIDLWATWCAPCKIEFKNYDDKFNVFLKENNIEKVFISIDNEKDKWKGYVLSSNLEGYHVIANEKLLTSIKEIIYDEKQMEIPRYILVNEKGKILSIDAPRPSDTNSTTIIGELLKK